MMRDYKIDLMRRFLERLVVELPEPRSIGGREYENNRYLSRWYLLGEARDTEDGELGEWHLPFNLFLHKFHRGDDDAALHSHPWRWSLAIVLAGGYSEERKKGQEVVRVTHKPGSLNFIRADDFHRVDLLEEDSWSLFIAGPISGSWYFWDRVTKMRAEWIDFINWKRGHAQDDVWFAEEDTRASGDLQAQVLKLQVVSDALGSLRQYFERG